MRPFESLLLLANLLAYFVLALPLRRAARWLRNLALGALPMAGLQALAEGPRWQMVPAYTLSGLLALARLLQGARPVGEAGGRPRATRFTAVLAGGLGLAASAALPAVLPVFRLPRPRGPYQIGTLTYHWRDAGRSEIFTANPDDRRELVVQIWYPAEGDASSRRAAYVQDGRLLAPAARLLHLPGFIFGHLKYVRTHAIPGAPVADGESSYPVLIFSHGRAGFRQNNTGQVEELVSHGYIVAAIDHPYAAAGVAFPDGRVAAFDWRLYDPLRPGHAAFLDEVIPFLAQDVIFTLDRLTTLNQADPNGILTGRLDLGRAGMFGSSLGGIIGAEACLLEPRLRACLVMDAFMPAQVVESGLQQPTMWISRDAQTMQLEGWMQADIDETQSTMRAVFEGLPGDGYLVLVPGMFHADFSDAPLFSPLTSRLGVSGTLRAQRARDIVNDFSLAFFDRHLKGRPAALLDNPAERYPEVMFETGRLS